jgi:hypothetical protein
VREERIENPVVIIGLPRSGTSFLQSLLIQDPGNRTPLVWEVARPCPPPDPVTYETDPRINASQELLERVHGLMPGLDVVHEVSARQPQECLPIMAHEFKSLQFFMQFDVSSYAAWFVQQDMAPVYSAHRRFLKHLQSGGVRAERWLLKSPAHLRCLGDLLREYPDACIIMTHRDPVQAASSLASMICILRRAGTDDIRPAAVGRQVVYWLARALDRAAIARKEPGGRIVDVRFEDLTSDPMCVVESIYETFGLDLAPATRERMQDYVEHNPRHKHGRHEYDSSDFGIVPDEIRERFREYIDAYVDGGE